MKRTPSLVGMASMLALGCASTPRAVPGDGSARVPIETPPTLLRNSPMPRYPTAAVPTGLVGTVVVSFVVTPDGVADSASVRVEESNHPAFTSAVLAALPRLRFTPAEMVLMDCEQIDGRPVLRNGRPACGGKPERTGRRVASKTTLPFRLSPPSS